MRTIHEVVPLLSPSPPHWLAQFDCELMQGRARRILTVQFPCRRVRVENEEGYHAPHVCAHRCGLAGCFHSQKVGHKAVELRTELVVPVLRQ
mmetsp:Transcript_21374/g.52502  ORF Transcript_21374/g.52502 Transcript_21374/m.52502 type:complete len:92 (-) Transcript_21374:518-793(-)